jgi:hypothetical protein
MKALEHLTVRRVVALKGVVGVGIMAAHFLPPQYAIIVSIGSNFIWLFKL